MCGLQLQFFVGGTLLSILGYFVKFFLFLQNML